MTSTPRTAARLVAAGVLALLLAATPAHAAFPGSNGKIAFESNRDGSFGVWKMNPDGTNATKVVATATDPAWSPDGQKIAFVRSGDIYWVYANGTGLTRVTFNASDDKDPAWSNNGARIAFWADRAGNNEVYTVLATNNGSAENGLVNVSNDASASDFAPAWTSGSTNVIAFQQFKSGGNNEVFKKNADGSGGATNISDNGANDGRPNWKPDNSLVAFHSNRDGSQDIWTMTGNGNSVTKRANTAATEDEPAYSPSGTLIAYHRDGEIYTSTEAGGSQTNRTSNAGTDGSADWQPADTVAPDTTIDSGPSGPTDESMHAFEFSSEDGATFECKLDDDPWSVCTSGTSSFYVDGAYTFSVRAIDVNGNVDASPATRSFTVDTVAPTVTISPFSTPTGDDTPTLGFSADEGDVEFECRLDSDDGDFEPCSSPQDLPELDDGLHAFDVRATDEAGNVGVHTRASFVVDTDPPETTLQPLASPTNDNTPPVEFTADEAGASFECAVDSTEPAAFAPCTSPFTTAELIDGDHEVHVRATDTAGNVGPVASEPVTVDTAPPDTTFTNQPAEFSPTTTGQIVFESSEDSTFECRLDGAASWTACDSPFVYDLQDGPHALEVRATDEAGNAEPEDETALAQWTIDTAAPIATLTPLTSPTSQTTPTAEFSSDETGSTFECSVDSTTDFEECESPFALAELDDGPHTFRVRAIDRAGNESAVASSAFTVDTTPPDTTIGGAPTGPTNQVPFSLDLSSSEDGSAFECRLGQSGDFEPCTATPEIDELDGTYVFQARATDAAGNVDTEPAEITFTIDTAAPDTTVVAPADPTGDDTPTIEFGATEPGSSFECRVDSTDENDFGTCTSPHTLEELDDGDHTFDVRATDAAGNVDASHTSAAFTVDTDAPGATITRQAGSATDTTPTFDLGADEDPVAFECAVDTTGDAAFEPCTTPHTVAPLSDGDHTVYARAIDAAGNTGAPASAAVSIDTTPPQTSIADAPPEWTNDPPVELGLASTEAGSAFECRRVGVSEFEPCTSPYVAGSADGAYAIEVRATDAAGNVDTTPASVTFNIDTTAPTATLQPLATPTRDDTPAMEFAANEPESTFECAVDSDADAAFAACNSPHALAPLADGEHTVSVRAIDRAGNVGAVASRTVVVDTTAPQTTIDAGPEGSTRATATSFDFSSEAGAAFECRIDAAEFTACTSPASYSGLAVGDHSFEVRARDALGNVDSSPARRDWRIEAEPSDPGPTGPTGPTVPSGPLGPGEPPRDTTVPGLSRFGLTNRVFRVGSQPTELNAAAKAKVGTVFRFRLSEAAAVAIVIERVQPGRLKGGQCVRETRSTRRLKPCKRFDNLGTLRRKGNPGNNSVAFSGRLARRALSPGDYRATLVATDAASNASRPSTATFRIVRR